MCLAVDIAARAAEGELETLQHELRRVDPCSVADMRELHAALLGVLRAPSRVDDDSRSELAVAWLRALEMSNCVDDLDRLHLYEAALEGLDDPNWLVRAALAESLAYVGKPEHIPRLLAIFQDTDEHRTVRVDALESALANAADSRQLLKGLHCDLASEPSAFVRWMVRLHALLAEVAPGPTGADLDAAMREDAESWPPQETFVRTLRTITRAYDHSSSENVRKRANSVIDWIEERGLVPLWEDLVLPAREAVKPSRTL